MSHTYDSNFMSYTEASSRHSARTISTLLRKALTIDSVLDIGCARGTWLSAWREQGAKNIFGVDGSYVSTDDLSIPRECFLATDLAQPFDLKRKFDLVQSLEVAEHIPAASADVFVENLVRHSSGIVLFSAAPPGQGGEFHVNEQPYEYWRAKFATHDYHAHDFVRPAIAKDTAVSFWYRYNTFLYVRADVANEINRAVRETKAPDTQSIHDISPAWFRIRKWLVRSLPRTSREWLARRKAQLLSRR